MTEKDLISKLNNLKNVNPDQNWLDSNRELLLSQISNSGAGVLPAWKVFIINLQSLAKAASHPAYALGVFIILLAGGSVFSHQLFNGAKPNDSLYIARIISEKAKLNTIFDNESRDKLAAQFATEHAQEITAVLSDPQFNNDSNKDQVAKLNQTFTQEIGIAKARLSSLAASKDKNASTVDSVVSMADYLKDNQGMEIASGTDANNLTVKNSAPVLNPNAVTSLLATSASSTLKATATIKVQEKEADKVADTNKILEEAQKLFDNKEYNNALDKLKEVDQIIK